MNVALKLAVATGRDRERIDATARAVIECAADAIIAFGARPDRQLWNPAAERLFGWTAAEVVGLEPPFIPEELQAEHNAVLERVASGGQVSFATRRIRKDGALLDLRIDASALVDSAGQTGRLGQRLPPDRGRRGGPALHGRAGPGGAPARRRGRGHERAARAASRCSTGSRPACGS